MEPERPKSNSTPRRNPDGAQQGTHLDPTASRGHGPYTQPPRAAKPKRKWLPALMVAAILGIGAVGAYYYMDGQGGMTPIANTGAHVQQALTLSGADVDQAATTAAIAAINAGQNDNPLIAHLSQQQKQEIVSGQRKFYKLPVIPAHITQPASAAPATADQQQASAAPVTPHGSTAPAKPAVHSPRPAPRQEAALPQPPQPQTAQPDSSPAPPQDVGPQDRVQVILDGVVYGTYNITSSPLTLDAPLKLGDVWSVACLELSAGKTSVTIGIGTVLNPVQTTLSVGQAATFTVTTSATATDYSWFETQANNGNPVAEYGLGHMYQYGLGVPQDTSQAIHWYQQAANQNYLDAKQRLAELGQ